MRRAEKRQAKEGSWAHQELAGARAGRKVVELEDALLLQLLKKQLAFPLQSSQSLLNARFEKHPVMR